MMHTLQFILIGIAILFAIARCVTRQYIFSALTSLTCAIAAMPVAPWLTLALVFSVIGDWFLAHKGDTEIRYLLGIVFFFVGHALFIVFAALHAATPNPIIWCVLIVIGVCYSLYLKKRAIIGVPVSLKPAVIAYATVSLVSFGTALSTRNALYAVGIGMLLFSDTMICEKDFVGNKSVAFLILPTYYACHILATLSVLL